MAKKYRVGIIGRTGRGAYGHGLDKVWVDHPQGEVVAVADDDKAGLAAAAKRLKAPQAYLDYRQMLDKEKPDIVSICPRWVDRHRDMVVAAAERGVHIYLEKPMCRTLAEADEMIEACERTHTRLVIAHQTRYSPKIPVVKDLLASGKLGTVLEYRGRGKEDRRGGGEDLWVLGTHIFDLIRNFGGDASWCRATVTQSGEPVTKEDVSDGAEGLGPLAGDAIHAMYGMPKEALAHFSSVRNMAGNPSRFALQIYGSRGALEIVTGYLPSVKYLPDGSWSPGRSGAKWLDVSSAGVDKPEPLTDGGHHAGNLAAVADLIRSIEEDDQPDGNIYQARGATEMIVAVFESHRQRGPVDIPLKNRQNPLAML